ncbi:MAG: oligosaccharide flippase family protein [Proteobacteria bacterium]|nr:oligosaccharide flippase family protein [Pseudomonadota bacterium]
MIPGLPKKENNVVDIASATATTSAIVFVRLSCQALVLVLSVRLLGVNHYGLITAVVAISLLLGPWGGLGFDFVALRDVSRDSRQASNYFWLGIRRVTRSSPLLIVTTMVIVWLWFSNQYPLVLVALILAAELIFLRVTELIARIFQGRDDFNEMATVRLMNSVARLAILLPMTFLVSGLTAVQWAAAYFVAAVLSLLFSLYLLQRKIGIKAPPTYYRIDGASDGIHFASGITAARLSSEFDKALVHGLAGANSAGIYGAGYRLVTFAVAPVISFVNVIVGSLFRMGADSQRVDLGKKSLLLCAVASGYGAVVSITLWVFLPAIASILLGEDFGAVAEGLLPLALLPAAMSCRLVAEQAMAALDEFRSRTTAQWSVAIIAVAANFLLIPKVGWTASAWVLFAGELALVIWYITAIIRSNKMNGVV